jgi:hypothetical protein
MSRVTVAILGVNILPEDGRWSIYNIQRDTYPEAEVAR